MKKRLLVLIMIVFSIFTLTSCSGKGCDLLILNWGDYISDDVVKKFEEEFGVKVRVTTTDTNEQMYSNIRNKTAEYDIVIPSDYMIDQMHHDDLLLALDYSKMSNYQEDMFVSELDSLMNSNDCKSYSGYYVPYFWGSLGIMYNKRLDGVEEAVKTNGFKVLFDHSLLPHGCKVGMYNSSRDALACAELYLGYSLNTKNKNEIDDCINLLRSTDFYQWGNDDLKLSVSQGKLDVALVYSGDFFDAYYSDLEAEEDSELDNTKNYSIYAPRDHNNVFFDAMVIPNTCTNYDLALEFINFMLDFDNSYDNADFIGYCPTLQSVFDDITSDFEGYGDILQIDAYNPTLIINEPNSWPEVYSYLGSDIYSYIEKKFTTVLFR